MAGDPRSAVPEHDAETFETVVPGLFVCGGMLAGNVAGSVFIEHCRQHGERIVDAICGRQPAVPAAGQ